MKPSWPPRTPSIGKQLFSNQLWETVAFLAKAVFMLGLTPSMLHVWGPVGYGEFAIATSAFVLLSLCDVGLRGRTRVELSKGISECKEKPFAMAESIALFGGISLAVLLFVGGVTFSHGWSHLLGIRREHETLLLVVTTLTLPYMASNLLLETVVVREGLGRIKMVAALGWAAAIPAVALCLWQHLSVLAAVAVWIGALFLANIYLLLARLGDLSQHLKGVRHISVRGIVMAYRESHWFNIASITWATKSHGLILLTGALSSPASAGLFFIVLRLSEIVSTLGAISFDVALTALPRCRSIAEKRLCLTTTCRYTLLFALPCAAGVAFFTPFFFRFWIKAAPPLGWSTGFWAAGLGLAIAANRLITYVSLGLGTGRLVALCGLAEVAVTLCGICWLQPLYGMAGVIFPAIAAVTVYLPAIAEIRRRVTLPAGESDQKVFPPFLPSRRPAGR